MYEFTKWLEVIGPSLRRYLGGIVFTRGLNVVCTDLDTLRKYWGRSNIEFEYDGGRDWGCDGTTGDYYLIERTGRGSGVREKTYLGDTVSYYHMAHKVTFL